MWLLTNSLELGLLAFLLNSFFLSSGFFPILWIFVGLAFAGVLVLLLLPGLVFQRVESLSRGGDDPSLKARWSYVKVGYEVFKDHPLFGVGPNNYKVAYASPEYRSAGYQSESNEEIGKQRGRVGRAAHNMYLEAISEIGLVGIALLIYIFLLTWKEFREAQAKFKESGNEKMWLLTNSLELGLLAFLLNSFFLSSGFFPILWIFVGLALEIVLKRSRKNEIRPPVHGLSAHPHHGQGGRCGRGRRKHSEAARQGLVQTRHRVSLVGRELCGRIER
jgi:O-antigen ligase